MNDRFDISVLPQLEEYEKVKEKNEIHSDDGVVLPGVHGEAYEKDIAGRIFSVGIFLRGNEPLYMAWGWKDEAHCSLFSVVGEDGSWLAPQSGCPVKTTKKDEQGNVVELFVAHPQRSRGFPL